MREITIEHEEWVKPNKKLRYKVEEKKIELQETEKYLEYLKSCFGPIPCEDIFALILVKSIRINSYLVNFHQVYQHYTNFLYIIWQY